MSNRNPISPALNQKQLSNLIHLNASGTNSLVYVNQSSSTSTYVSNPWISTSATSSSIAHTLATEVTSVLLGPESMVRMLQGDGIRLNDTDTLVERDGNIVLQKKMHDGSSHRIFVPERYSGDIDLQSRFLDVDKSCTIRLPDGSIIATRSDGSLIHEKISGAEERTIRVTEGTESLYECLAFCTFGDIHIPQGVGKRTKFTLPNGTVLTLGDDDRVVVDDSNGKTLYESPATRSFNRYLNASDLLEDFVEFCGKNNLSKKEFSELPIAIFIYWLIVKAAEADGDSTEEVLPLLTTAVKDNTLHTAKCKCCGKYLPKKFVDNGINFCSTEHMSKFMEQKALV